MLSVQGYYFEFVRVIKVTGIEFECPKAVTMLFYQEREPVQKLYNGFQFK